MDTQDTALQIFWLVSAWIVLVLALLHCLALFSAPNRSLVPWYLLLPCLLSLLTCILSAVRSLDPFCQNGFYPWQFLEFLKCEMSAIEVFIVFFD